ncbi:hypothetical protein C8N46_104372 [Kordia periserrulae]|uniref:Uncharacterized protein n=1 Tax=Kordia periserrulae TaxID=701523 RepID=A0A2T6C095_9FLAO|nr:hypothetical protein [Kordia periserrulae]PTX61728.1 hypothetical protein C8N46_104372 [Kordia periserrulae]
MKKRNLKSLHLNKKSISSLAQFKAYGGREESILSITTISVAWCYSDTCISTVYQGPVQPTCANC